MFASSGYKVGMTPAATSAPSVAVPQGMTHDEYIGMWEALKKKQKTGLITHDEYLALGSKLDDAYHQKKTVFEIDKVIGCDPGTLATDESILKLGKNFIGNTLINIYKMAWVKGPCK